MTGIYSPLVQLERAITFGIHLSNLNPIAKSNVE